MVSSNFVQFAVLNSDGMLYRFSADGLIMVIMVWLTSRDCLAQSCNDSLSYILYNIWTSCGELLEVFSPFFFWILDHARFNESIMASLCSKMLDNLLGSNFAESGLIKSAESGLIASAKLFKCLMFLD